MLILMGSLMILTFVQTLSVDTVDDNGCSEAQRQIDTDSDNDVYDYLDVQCANTPR